jgi:hypothetical protein
MPLTSCISLCSVSFITGEMIKNLIHNNVQTFSYPFMDLQYSVTYL